MLGNIDHIYVIHNLQSIDEKVIRRRNALFETLSIFDKKYYEFSYFIDGKNIDDNIRSIYEDSEEEKIEKAKVKSKHCTFDIAKLSNSELSLAINHIKVLEKALNDGYQNYIMICEDDVVFCDNFINRFNKYIKNIPENVDFLSISDGGIKVLTNPPKNIKVTKKYYYKINQSRCTDCLIINCKKISSLLSHLKTLAFPIDFSFNWIFAKYQYDVYWLVPNLVTQNRNYPTLINHKYDNV